MFNLNILLVLLLRKQNLILNFKLTSKSMHYGNKTRIKESRNVSIASIFRTRCRAFFNDRLCSKFRRPRLKVTKEVIQKMKSIATKPNPTSYRDIAAITSLSVTSINTIIHKNLKLNTRKKCKILEFNAKQKKNRKTKDQLK